MAFLLVAYLRVVLLLVCGLRFGWVGGWALLGTQLVGGFSLSGLPLGDLPLGGWFLRGGWMFGFY